MPLDSIQDRPDAATRTAARETDARFEVVHIETLRFFPELVVELGGDPAPLMRKARIDPFIFDKRGSVLEYRSFVQLLELAAAELNCPDFGMRLAMLQGGHKVIGPVGVVMKNSKTVGQALGYCAKHIHAYSLATRVRFEPDRANHRLFVGLEILLENMPQRSQAVEHGLLLANRNIRDISGEGVTARAVMFRHPPVAAPEVYRAMFGCDVRFGQRSDALMLTENDLLCEVAEADEQIYEMATSFIDTRFPPATPPMHAGSGDWCASCWAATTAPTSGSRPSFACIRAPCSAACVRKASRSRASRTTCAATWPCTTSSRPTCLCRG
jgi:hypothetical protein